MQLKPLLEETERLYIKTMETIKSNNIEELTGRLVLLQKELNSDDPSPSAALEMAIIGIQLMDAAKDLRGIEKIPE